MLQDFKITVLRIFLLALYIKTYENKGCMHSIDYSLSVVKRKLRI